MKIGYARVSTEDQDLQMQIEALEADGCERIFKEKISGTRTKRPEFDKMMEQLREGDKVVVWKLDRLGRSTIGLIKTVETWRNKGIHFYSLTEGMRFDDTANGKMMFGLFAIIAEYERNVISERTKAALASRRKQGRIGGRPKGLSKEAKITAAAAAHLYEKGDLSISQICKQLSIARSTLYKYLKHENIKVNGSSNIKNLQKSSN